MCPQPPDGGSSALYSKHTNGCLGPRAVRAGVLMLSAGLKARRILCLRPNPSLLPQWAALCSELGRARDPKTGEKAPTLWHGRTVVTAWPGEPALQGRHPRHAAQRHPAHKEAPSKTGRLPRRGALWPEDRGGVGWDGGLSPGSQTARMTDAMHPTKRTHPPTIPLFPLGGKQPRAADEEERQEKGREG